MTRVPIPKYRGIHAVRIGNRLIVLLDRAEQLVAISTCAAKKVGLATSVHRCLENRLNIEAAWIPIQGNDETDLKLTILRRIAPLPFIDFGRNIRSAEKRAISNKFKSTSH